MTLLPNELLANRYRILDVLGQGGMGAVYKAEDTRLGATVAVKENLFTSAQHARQFQREANLLATLQHRHLPRVSAHFVIEEQGQYLVMDYIPGDDTRELLAKNGPLPEGEVVRWGLQVCSALAYLHDLDPPVVHRDIKPGNIKITPEGEAFLVDFGLAKMQAISTVTTTGARGMTPGFSPPEQYGTARTDARSDIYSLGATFYNLLTGKVPEDGLARAIGSRQLAPLRQHNRKVSSAVARTIERAMSIKMEDRFQTVLKFSRALWEGAVESITTWPLEPLSEQGAVDGAGPTTPAETRVAISGRFVAVRGGEQLTIPPGKTEGVLGRRDPEGEFLPEVDVTECTAEEDGVSRRHAKLWLVAGQLHVQDLNSTNQTYLNNQRLQPGEMYPLNPGDELRLGKLRLVYQN